MTRFVDQPEFDFVLINRSKKNHRYHRPVQESFGVSSACGCNVRDMAQVDESVATNRYKASRCGRCWR